MIKVIMPLTSFGREREGVAKPPKLASFLF